MYTNKLTLSLISISLFISTIIVVSTHGKNNRIIAPVSTTHVIESPKEAYQIWLNKRVWGRTLLLFDKYPHLRTRINYSEAPLLTQSNLIEFSVMNNTIRRVYFIVPDNMWGEFIKQEAMTNPFREATSLERGMYLFNLNGIPLIALPLSSLPHIPEKPLVYINNSVFNRLQIMEYLRLHKISSDCIISLQGVSR